MLTAIDARITGEFMERAIARGYPRNGVVTELMSDKGNVPLYRINRHLARLAPNEE